MIVKVNIKNDAICLDRAICEAEVRNVKSICLVSRDHADNKKRQKTYKNIC